MASTSQSAHVLDPSAATAAINAHESNLADYLNQPVHDILPRLGLPALPQAAPPSAGDPNAASPAGAANNGALSSLSSLAMMPMMLIQPVTDALGTLGSGQFGALDPTQMFGGIAQAFESAGQSVQQAMSGLDGVWQGQAASAAVAKTSAALANGAQIASQASGLGASLSAATASVGQAEAELIAIVNQFMATLAAIGPNIIFPWGWAAVIAAANLAVTQATQVMTQLVGSLGAEAGNVAAIGAPVGVTSAPQVGSNLAAGAATPASAASAATAPASALRPISALAAPTGAALGAPAAGAGAPVGATSGLGSSFVPMVGMASGLASPAMEGVSAATGALGSGAGQGGAPAQLASSTNQQGQTDDGDPNDPSHHKAGLGGGSGHGAAGGVPVIPAQSRLAAPMPVAAVNDAISAANNSDAIVPATTGGAPMMAGAPLARGANAGVGRTHSAAAFLHTTGQGSEIIGDLGGVAPSVVGVREENAGPDIELRI